MSFVMAALPLRPPAADKLEQVLTRRTSMLAGVLLFIGIVLLGVLVDGSGTASANPLTGVSDVAVGTLHSCALTTAGGVKCWGDNIWGQLGDGTTVRSSVPVDVVGLSSGVSAIAIGTVHTCALTITGGVKCWGINAFGQLGNGTTVDSSTPVDVVGLTGGVVAIGAGELHSCAVTSSGSVKCWGDNRFGQLGDGTFVNSLTPVAVTGISAAVAVESGFGHSCAVTAAGGLLCWGINIFGQLGDSTTGSSGTPVGVSGLAVGAAAVAVGGNHSCVLTSSGGVKCWGDNAFGQLGDGTTTGHLTPADVPGLTAGVSAVAAGIFSSCAIGAAGAVQCWGTPYGATPVVIEGLESGMTGVAMKVSHACAVAGSGGVKCWGSNGQGQLGDGTEISRVVPVDVVELTVKPTPTSTPCPGGICPTPTPVPLCPAEACVALAVLDTAGNTICHSDVNAKCEIAIGSSFTLAVDAVKVPDAGYVGMNTFVYYAAFNPSASEDGAGPGTCDDNEDNGLVGGGDRDGADRSDPDCKTENLTYKPTASAIEEIVWSECAVAVRGEQDASIPYYLQLPGYTLHHSCLTGLLPPLPISHHVGTLVEIALTCSPEVSSTDVTLLPYSEPNFGTVAGPSGTVFAPELETIIVPKLRDLTINCVEPPTPTPTATPPPIPKMQKCDSSVTASCVSLFNVFLTRQGAKIPPLNCLAGDNIGALSEALSQAITSPDPKDPESFQQIGAFEFEVHYDNKKVCVDLTPGEAWTPGGSSLNDPVTGQVICIVEDDEPDSKPQLEGVARIGCVTVGKGLGISGLDALAQVDVYPQPEIYSQAKPNQDNGVVVQINNVNCDVGDEQGHAIPIFSCDDASITFRYLEGDVEPDCAVDAADAQAIAFRWGVEKGSVIYKDFMNLEPSSQQADDDIDINDLQFVYGRFGSTCEDPHPPQPPVNLGFATPTPRPTNTPTNTPTGTPTPTPTPTPEIRIDSFAASVGQQGSVDITALNISPPGLGAWTVDITYDPSVVSVVTCVAFQGGICNPFFTSMTIRDTGASASGPEGDIVLARITFECMAAGVSGLNLSLNVFADATIGDPQDISGITTIQNGSVTCS